MKKRYKKTPRATSYKVALSKYYNCYALLINGKESAWGDKESMTGKAREEAKKTKK